MAGDTNWTGWTPAYGWAGVQPSAIAQGWECPKCGGVYAPYTPMCFSCGNAKFVTQPWTGTGDPIPNPDTTVWSGVNGTIAGSPDLNIGGVMYGAN